MWRGRLTRRWVKPIAAERGLTRVPRAVAPDQVCVAPGGMRRMAGCRDINDRLVREGPIASSVPRRWRYEFDVPTFYKVMMESAAAVEPAENAVPHLGPSVAAACSRRMPTRVYGRMANSAARHRSFRRAPPYRSRVAFSPTYPSAGVGYRYRHPFPHHGDGRGKNKATRPSRFACDLRSLAMVAGRRFCSDAYARDCLKRVVVKDAFVPVPPHRPMKGLGNIAMLIRGRSLHN